MTDTPETTSPASSSEPQIPRAKMWLFALIFFVVAASMYGGTMYRINTYGYTGIGEDQKANPAPTPAPAAQN